MAHDEDRTVAHDAVPPALHDAVPPALEETPPVATVERWVWDFIHATSLSEKMSPSPPPSRWEIRPPPRRIERPGRPESLLVNRHAPKTPSAGALQAPAKRAELIHRFLHHELQAAELMGWALLAFPTAPLAFRRGLLQILGDEVRHMGHYQDYLGALGYHYGNFPVRDWFWERVPSSQSPAHFVAVLGIGFEGANLDHTHRFAERFRAAGDLEGAALQDQIGEEEVPHVRFAMRWFREWTGGVDFTIWAAHLPPPLSPILMRGRPIHRKERRRSGFSDSFLDELEQWAFAAPGS